MSELAATSPTVKLTLARADPLSLQSERVLIIVIAEELPITRELSETVSGNDVKFAEADPVYSVMAEAAANGRFLINN